MTQGHAAAASGGGGGKPDFSGKPLDYSFMELSTLEGLLKEDPVEGVRKPDPAETSKKSTAGGSGEDGGLGGASEEVAVLVDGGVHEEKPKVPIRLPGGIRLCNNKFGNLDGLLGCFDKIFYTDCRNSLFWIDLSFNELAGVPEELLQITALKVLNLHVNKIAGRGEVAKLRALKQLRKLSLHGNPIEEKPGKPAYREFVVSTLPTLKELDFCAITKKDRELALHARKMRQAQKLRQKMR